MASGSCCSLPLYANQQQQQLLLHKVSARKLRKRIEKFTHVKLSTVHSPAAKHKPGNSDPHANIGHALRTLREELPCLFYKDLSYDIYRKDITFRDPMNIFQGLNSYKLIFSALRFNGRIFFKAIWLEILSVWQPSDRVIVVRWSVQGIPRVPWEAKGHFDGTSEYKLDSNGKIYEHKVDNVILNSPPKYKVAVTMVDLAATTCSLRISYLLLATENRS